jgi:hypothetical protein
MAAIVDSMVDTEDGWAPGVIAGMIANPFYAISIDDGLTSLSRTASPEALHDRMGLVHCEQVSAISRRCYCGYSCRFITYSTSRCQEIRRQSDMEPQRLLYNGLLLLLPGHKAQHGQGFQ